mmetsp:Transcript_158826/g.280610  ORF Transcript_158826/g.280610 Transcript_158826/m.280610 type:complete len:378 (+) Transcript_158826:53-1186(+)
MLLDVAKLPQRSHPLALVAGFLVSGAGLSALILWLRRKRCFGISLGVRSMLAAWQQQQTPVEPSADFLAAARKARDEGVATLSALERFLSIRPSWSKETNIRVAYQKVLSSHDGKCIPIRIISSKKNSQDAAPLCLYIHGGGWVFLGNGSHDHIGNYLAQNGNVVTVMVDYRLSPEHKYPVPLNDCMDAFKWCVANSRALGTDPNHFVVAGDSAGGNLALAVCMKAREEQLKVPVLRQLLVYPCVSRRLVNAKGGSYEKFYTGWNLTRQTMQWFWHMYLGVDVDSALSPSVEMHAAPLDADVHLGDLPPTFILLADHDVLYDDGILLADKLRSAGVPVKVDAVGFTLHGMFAQRGWDTTAWDIFMEKSLQWILQAKS